jgi:hypothetical protein
MDIRKHARRILAGTVKGSAGVLIFPEYIPFEEHDRPRWWRDELAVDSWGAVLGVHEAEAGSPVGAILITDRGLGVFSEPSTPMWLPYEQIKGYEKLSKEPVSRSLVLRTQSGGKITLLFRPDGAAFAFVQFLLNAIRESNRLKDQVQKP